MAIKVTGIDTPFGGLSWETEDTNAIIRGYIIILNNRRLVSMPWDRKPCNLLWEVDAQYCMDSALYIKHLTDTMLVKHEFPFSTQKLFSNICSHCNDFLTETANAVHGTSGIISLSFTTENIDDYPQLKFISAVKLFKENVNEEMQQLVKLYSFKGEEMTEILSVINRKDRKSVV